MPEVREIRKSGLMKALNLIIICKDNEFSYNIHYFLQIILFYVDFDVYLHH